MAPGETVPQSSAGRAHNRSPSGPGTVSLPVKLDARRRHETLSLVEGRPFSTTGSRAPCGPWIASAASANLAVLQSTMNTRARRRLLRTGFRQAAKRAPVRRQRRSKVAARWSGPPAVRQIRGCSHNRPTRAAFVESPAARSRTAFHRNAAAEPVLATCRISTPAPLPSRPRRPPCAPLVPHADEVPNPRRRSHRRA